MRWEKLEESKGYNYFFIVFCVLELKQISSNVRNLLSNKSQFAGQF